MQITKPFVHTRQLPRVTEDEIRMMLKLARVEGTVEMDEEVLCNRVFKLNDVRAVQIMKPMDQIYALPADKTLAEVREDIINSRFSRIAVYDKDPLDIVGMVQHRILLREIAKDNYNAKVRDFMTDPIFVNWFTKADALLEKFQVYHQHLFIVQDAKGQDVGIVTMEDVLEELFGEIYDEKDIIKPKPKIIINESVQGKNGQAPKA
jgi:putative hemolysin